MENIQNIKELFNPIQSQILDLIATGDKGISELHKSIKNENGKNYDYKAIHKQVKYLEKNKFIKLEKDKKEQGKPVKVKRLEKAEKLTLLKTFMEGLITETKSMNAKELESRISKLNK